MARRLYALLPEPGEALEFAIADEKGVRMMPTPPSGLDSKDAVTVFVPSTEVGCFEVRLPSQSAAELRRSAVFAIEDDLAVPVEAAHVAIGAPTATGLRPVHVVDPDVMRAWVSQLGTLGLKDARLVADASVLPAGPVAVDASAHILLSLGTRKIAIDSSLPDDALKALAATAPDGLTASTAALAQRLGCPVADRDPLPLVAQLAAWAEQGGALTDLRQGEFATRRQRDIRLGAWRPALALAAGVAVAFLVLTGIEAFSLNRLANVLDRQARAIYTASFPGTPVPANLSAAVRTQETAPLAARLSFLDAAALLYEAVPVDSGISIQALRYDRQTGRLVANLVYPAYGADIDLKRDLESRGLGVTLGDSRQQDGQVLGDLTLQVAQ
ncbi:type II secretion system protein GspL [Hyphomonas johnsonii]|uniref:General secretion pathway protein L n=1 Tax=Hyphomonas johnsonii MHS-2 TaxID=1280950 RepID=A0A059FUB5_9PROT|nr:type II secretion system protein GspL [Hyphomonas johnsonii]KCZ94300.1 general secretion pathway protein L [Hyphomonas johnsonii MHS-2]